MSKEVLENLLREYREAKIESDKWEKKVKELGIELKKLMIDSPVIEVDGKKFERKVSYRSKVDEEGLLGYLKENKFEDLITTKEIIDEEKLSELVTSGNFDVSIIDKFTKKTEIVSIYSGRGKNNGIKEFIKGCAICKK